MRITGLATGLDIDEVVKSSMQAYRIKIQQTQQKQDVLEIKQKLYRDVINDGREFYNKYFDVSKSDSLLLSKNWSTSAFTSSDEAAVSVKGQAGADVSNYKVSVKQLATAATATVAKDKITVDGNINLRIDGKNIEISSITQDEVENPSKLISRINEELKKNEVGVTAKYSEFSKGIIFETTAIGETVDGKINTFTLKVNNQDTVVTAGKDCEAVITNSKGEKYEHKSNKNALVLDKIEFAFNDVTGSEEVRITGKKDITSIKDKLVSFINDYNTLMKKLNTLTTEKRNRDYSPLTDEQKSELSESEIELWNKKVEQGQLYKDSDVSRIVNNMKKAMRTMVDGVGGNLEKYGITPVSDYSGTNNGTFTIDEEKLTAALENNSEDIMKMFIGSAPSDSSLSESEKYNQTGIMQRLKSVLYDEVVTVSSPLLKKAGIEGSATSSNNQLTKQIESYKRKIEDMESIFSTKEQALYSKWATVETLMNNLNSQQSTLSSYLGS